jgi:hypothetical protein
VDCQEGGLELIPVFGLGFQHGFDTDGLGRGAQIGRVLPEVSVPSTTGLFTPRCFSLLVFHLDGIGVAAEAAGEGDGFPFSRNDGVNLMCQTG